MFGCGLVLVAVSTIYLLIHSIIYCLRRYCCFCCCCCCCCCLIDLFILLFDCTVDLKRKKKRRKKRICCVLIYFCIYLFTFLFFIFFIFNLWLIYSHLVGYLSDYELSEWKADLTDWLNSLYIVMFTKDLNKTRYIFCF